MNRCGKKTKKLLSTAVPSVFDWSVGETDLAVSRRLRLERRTTGKAVVHHSPTLSDLDVPSEDSHCDIDDIASEVICGDCEPQDINSKCSQTDFSFLSSQCSSTQTVNKEAVHFLSFDQLSGDEQLLHYYTGLESVKKLVAVFATLGPDVNHLNYHRTKSVDFDFMSPMNQFILMLAKLRQNLDYFRFRNYVVSPSPLPKTFSLLGLIFVLDNGEKLQACLILKFHWVRIKIDVFIYSYD